MKDRPASERIPAGVKAKRKGHGRRAAATYGGAKKVTVAHEQLKPGDVCPGCDDGRLYDTQRPAVLLHLHAQPILAGTVFELAKLRCALCGKLFSATAPAEAGQEKYDLNVAPTPAVMRYGHACPPTGSPRCSRTSAFRCPRAPSGS